MIETMKPDTPAAAEREGVAERESAVDRHAGPEKTPVLRLRGARWTSRFAANGTSAATDRRTRAF